MKLLRKFRYKNITSREALFWIILFSLAVTGIFVIRYMTPYGLGLVNDSVGYIAGARNILLGNGYSRFSGEWRAVPITNYPPMFSIAIAALSSIGLEAIRASRLLILLCFATNMVLTGIIIRKLTCSRILAILSTAFLFSLEPILRIHTFALSEPLYLLFTLLFLISIFFFIDQEKWYWLAASGLLTCAAILTRYVGLTLIGVVVILLMIMPATMRKRLVNFAVFFCFCLPGFVIWLIRNYLVSGNAVNRQLIFHPVPLYKIQEGIQNFWDWFMPEWIPGVSNPSFGIGLTIFVILFLAFLVFTLVNLVRSINNPKSDTQNAALYRMSIGVHGTGYLAVLVISLMFVDSSPIFEDRILLPFMVSLMLFLIFLTSALCLKTKTWSRYTFLLLFIIGFVFSIPDSLKTAYELNQSGQGYFTWGWRSSQTIAELKTLNPNAIYSNKPNAIYILANLPSYTLTSPFNPATLQYREGYQESLLNIKKRVSDGDAILVIFDFQYYMENPDDPEFRWIFELTEGLPVIEECFDGTIFGIIR